jgi:hypothetical protein
MYVRQGGNYAVFFENSLLAKIDNKTIHTQFSCVCRKKMMMIPFQEFRITTLFKKSEILKSGAGN